MKKIFLLIGIILLMQVSCNAESLQGSVYSEEYEDFLEQVNLTEKQRAQIMHIRNEESCVIRPLIVDLKTKEQGIEFLKTLKCDWRDAKCKVKLRDDIEQREIERRNALRKISQKKDYYRLRYRNTLTREQDIKIQKLIAENDHKDKVIQERLEDQAKREKREKRKFWKKIDLTDFIRE